MEDEGGVSSLVIGAGAGVGRGIATHVLRQHASATPVPCAAGAAGLGCLAG